MLKMYQAFYEALNSYFAISKTYAASSPTYLLEDLHANTGSTILPIYLPRETHASLTNDKQGRYRLVFTTAVTLSESDKTLHQVLVSQPLTNTDSIYSEVMNYTLIINEFNPFNALASDEVINKHGFEIQTKDNIILDNYPVTDTFYLDDYFLIHGRINQDFYRLCSVLKWVPYLLSQVKLTCRTGVEIELIDSEQSSINCTYFRHGGGVYRTSYFNHDEHGNDELDRGKRITYSYPNLDNAFVAILRAFYFDAIYDANTTSTTTHHTSLIELINGVNESRYNLLPERDIFTAVKTFTTLDDDTISDNPCICTSVVSPYFKNLSPQPLSDETQLNTSIDVIERNIREYVSRIDDDSDKPIFKSIRINKTNAPYVYNGTPFVEIIMDSPVDDGTLPPLQELFKVKKSSIDTSAYKHLYRCLLTLDYTHFALSRILHLIEGKDCSQCYIPRFMTLGSNDHFSPVEPIRAGKWVDYRRVVSHLINGILANVTQSNEVTYSLDYELSEECFNDARFVLKEQHEGALVEFTLNARNLSLDDECRVYAIASIAFNDKERCYEVRTSHEALRVVSLTLLIQTIVSLVKENDQTYKT